MLQCSMKWVETAAGIAYVIVQCSNMEYPAMAKTATSPFPARSFKLPELKLAKLDLDTLFAAQKANLAALQEAQGVLVDAVQAVAKAQHGYLEQSVAAAQAALKGRAPRTPAAVLAEVKAGAERTGAAGKQIVDLVVAAQRRVAELVSQRTKANVDGLKVLAAA
jgi:hypothetical protein